MDAGVLLGPLAVTTPEMIRSTLLHENVHVKQARANNWGKQHKIGHTVNEAEAYKKEYELKGVSGISEKEANRIAAQYWKRLDDLSKMGQAGDYYLRQILIYESFELRPEDKDTKPLDWLK